MRVKNSKGVPLVLYIFSLTGLIVVAFAEILYLGHLTNFIYSAFPLLFSLLFLLAYDGQNSLRLLGSSFVIALILCIPLIGIDTWTDHQREFVLIYPLLAYLVHCFHYTWHRNGHNWDFNYATLFEAAWNTIVILLFGVIFDFAINCLVYIAAVSFNKMGSTYFYTLNMNLHFVSSLGILCFFIGAGIAQKHIPAFNQLRFTAVTCMYYFLPILILTTIVYLFLFLLKLYKNPAENPSLFISVFFELIVISIIFLNAYYQDGSKVKNRMGWLNAFLRFYKVLLLMMILIINYYAFTRISLDINQIIILTITLFLGWVYAQSAFLSETKAQRQLEYANKSLAIVFVVALFMANLPYLSPDFILNKDSPNATLWSFIELIRRN